VDRRCACGGRIRKAGRQKCWQCLTRGPTGWPHYRLRVLKKNGTVQTLMTGSLVYLLRIGALGYAGRGRKWVEMNTEPALGDKR